MILLKAARHFGKSVTMDFAPDGVRYELLVARADMETATDASTAPAAQELPAAS
jgi:hypothetical protein